MSSFEAKMAAIAAMARRRDPADVPALVASLEEPAIRPGPLGSSRSVRMAAREALVAMGGSAAPPLRRALEEALGSPLALEIVHTLCAIEHPSADQALVWLLGREEVAPVARWVAAGALGARGVSASREALLGRLADPDVRVRGVAIWSLGRLPYGPTEREEVRAALLPLLSSPEVGDKAAVALGLLGEPTVEGRLIEQLSRPIEGGDNTPHAEAARALASIAAAALCRMLDDPRLLDIHSVVASALHGSTAPEARAAIERYRRRLDPH